MIPQAQIDRFARDLADVHDMSAYLGLAVSGGPDSLALLLLAHAVLPGKIMVASVDHGLRKGSGVEVDFVGRICADLGIPFAPLSVTVNAGNMLANARAARYAALDAWMAESGLETLASAHHADDQAETLLMRLNRGSGLAGLSAIRARTYVPGSMRHVIRPLLGWRKAELEALVHAAGYDAVQDPSNRVTHYDRVRMRGLLNDCRELDVPALAKSAAYLAEYQNLFDYIADDIMASDVHFAMDKADYRPFARYYGAIARPLYSAVLMRIFAHFGAAPRGSDIMRLADRLCAGTSGNLAGILITPTAKAPMAQPDSAILWRFCAEPARRN